MLDKKYNFKTSEEKWQSYWEENDIYRFDKDSEKELYSIDTPPPTISGSLHIGHIFSYTQAEMIARFHRMMGKNVFYPFGFDDNGLPTERLVEKDKGIIAKNLPRSEFINMCLETTDKYENEFKDLWKSLGFSVDWELEYKTIGPKAQRISQSSFLELARKGKAYLKETPVLWCTNCQTSIAQAEIEFTETETTFIWIPFIIEGKEFLIATTRPELLYGCVVLFINPKDERCNKYIGKEALVPLYNFSIPILGDDKVNIEKGSGIVMCATFGDTTDLEWYIDHDLPYKKVINFDGTIDKNVPFIGGLKVKDARKEIIDLLNEKKLIRKSEKIIHSVAIHERCSNDIEIIPSKQWFIDVLSEKEKYLKAANEINWYPESMKTRYENWVLNLKWDWCISRQRYFGVPIPVWYCSDCGEVIYADDEALPVNPLETKPPHACNCGCSTLIPESAVLDTWATSSTTPLINSKWGEVNDLSDKLLPMSMRTQAHEIIRTWAFYTIVKSIYHTGQIPWKDIMVCGFVMAKKGEKISKSKNNSSLSPSELIEKHSADALRYWAASAKLGTDTMFSEEELQISNKFLNKLWNAAKFALMHLTDYNPNSEPQLMPIDKWILEKLKAAESKSIDFLNEYEIGCGRHSIDDFFWRDFCDNYLEIVKDRLYKPEIHGVLEKQSAQYALYHTLLGILKLYSIYVPHITEEIYQAYFSEYEKNISIHKICWNKNSNINNEILSFGETIINIVGEARKFKSERNLSLKEPLELIEVSAAKETLADIMSTYKDLAACTGAKKISIISSELSSVIIK